MEYTIVIEENTCSEFKGMTILPVKEVTMCNLMITYGYVPTCAKCAGRLQCPNQCSLVFMLGEYFRSSMMGLEYINGLYKVWWVKDKLKQKIQIVDFELVGCPPIEEPQNDLQIANTSELQLIGDYAPKYAYLYKNWIVFSRKIWVDLTLGNVRRCCT